MGELQAGADLDEAIERRREELRALVAPVDAVHLLGQVIFSEMPMDVDAYQESEHPGAAYVVEMVAAELLLRPSRAGTSETTPAIDAKLLGPVRELCQEAALLESFRRYRAAGAFDSPEGNARGRAASHHLLVRSPGWPWQEHSTLRGLFGLDPFRQRLRAVLGFDAEDAIGCTSAFADLVVERVSDHMAAARDTVGQFGEDHPAHRWASVSLGGWKAGPKDLVAHAITAVWAMNHLGDALLFTADELAAAASIDRAAAAAFLAALSQPMQRPEADWFRLAESVRMRPFIEFGPGEYMPTVPGNDLWALRGVLETALKGDAAYNAHRAQWLEKRAAEVLEAAMAPDEMHLGVGFAYEAADHERVQGEIDALLRCGDTAIVIEAKSATLRPGARRGGDAFIKHLRENVTKAADQGTRARAALAQPGSLLRDGAVLTLSDTVREVHPIVVTLDDVSSAAPVLWQLEGTRVMPEGVSTPWVVTLHELELVASTIEWPAQFVHFLRRRSRLNQLGRHISSDELDWWMHYLEQGLYFEDEDDPSPVRVVSLTDPLDAWVLYEQGLRQVPAPKPTMGLDRSTRAFLDLLCSERPPGWVAAGCALLDVSDAARKRLWRDLDKLRPRARSRTRAQRGTYHFENAPGSMLICAVVLPDNEASRASQVLRDLVDARLEEFGDQRVLGLATTVSSSRPYDALLTVERTWWEPPAAPGAPGT